MLSSTHEDQETDEWEELLSQSTYWRVLRITAWVLRLKANSLAKLKKKKKKSVPLYTEELAKAKQYWVKKPDDIERPGWKLIKDQKANLLKCTGRIQEYMQPCLSRG